jgi:outer membrane receptor for ferrienterochelin and colicins
MRLLLLTSFLFFSITIFAQTGVVRGEVFDDNGLLPGVDISVSKVSTSISTDADGAFAIKLKPGKYDFVFRFPQYNNEERVVTIEVSEMEDIEVEMKLEELKNERLEQEKNTQLQLEEILSVGQGVLIFMKQMILRIE